MSKSLIISFIISLIVIGPVILIAQNQAQLTTYRLQPAADPIILDGILDEETWERAEIVTDFYMNIPTDDRSAAMESEVRMTYDQQIFYFGITCYDGDEGYVVQSLRRDFAWSLNENFSIYLNPYNAFTTGSTFGITFLGVQLEGTFDEGSNVNLGWDKK